MKNRNIQSEVNDFLKTLGKHGLALLLIINISCSDIFEKDISEQELIILSPQDSLETETFSVVFWWEHLQGAYDYNIQIVSPDFNAPATVVVDTFTIEDRFELTLAPGNYQWRIRALNGAYATAYQTRTLTIVNTNDLSKQVVKLTSPSNHSFSNKKNLLTFEWEPLSIADSYRFEVEGFPSLTQELEDNNLELALPDEIERSYRWSVTALNEESFRKSETFTVTLDYTNPLSSLINNLEEGDTISSLPFTIVWDRRSEDVQRDSVFLYTNEAFTQLVEGYPIVEPNIGHSVNNQILIDEGRYYIRLKSVDRAGNSSIYSPTISFRYIDEE